MTTSAPRKAAAKATKFIDLRIENAYRTHCAMIPIDIMDITKVFEAGRQAIADGVDDAGLGSRLLAFAESIRTDRAGACP